MPPYAFMIHTMTTQPFTTLNQTQGSYDGDSMFQTTHLQNMLQRMDVSNIMRGNRQDRTNIRQNRVWAF